MSIYTIAAYRPNSHYSRRQCVMGTSESDFELHVCQTFDEAVEIGASYLMKDADRDEAYAEWELNFLVDGMDENAWWGTDPDYVSETTWDTFDRLAREKCAQNLRDQKRKKEEADLEARMERDRLAAKAALAEQQRAEERDLEEFKRLSEKFGSGA